MVSAKMSQPEVQDAFVRDTQDYPFLIKMFED